MNNELMCCFIVIFFATFSIGSCKTRTNDTVERPVLVGAFNIQKLGQRKMKNKTVMDIVKRVLLRYDLIVIQEIVTTNEELMDNLVEDLNKLHHQKDSKYMMEISERLGRGNSKEQYAFLYRNDKFKFLTGHTYPDSNDYFMRPPYIGHFETPKLRDMQSMLVIGVHTQPRCAANEISAMAKVYDYAAKTFKVKEQHNRLLVKVRDLPPKGKIEGQHHDAIMMGDMNAGCAYVRISDWDQIEFWKRADFTWLTTHDYDTTLSVNCCPYDRIVIAGDGMEDAVIRNSVAAFKFRDFYELSTDTALAVSDHWPVEVKLRGGTSESAKSNLKPSLCLTLHDVRSKSLPPQLQNQRTTFGFTIIRTETATELYSKSSNDFQLLQKLRNLQSRYQQLISKETVDAVVYKVEHGALNDVTSNDDLEHSLFSILIHFDVAEETTTVHYCTSTTIN